MSSRAARAPEKPATAGSSARETSWPGTPVIARQLLLDSAVGTAEFVSVPPATAANAGYSPRFQFAYNAYGRFDWMARHGLQRVEAGQILFVHGEQEFEEWFTRNGYGHGTLIITPSVACFDELFPRGSVAVEHAFRDEVQSGDRQLDRRMMRFAHAHRTTERLARELEMLLLLADIARLPPPRKRSGHRAIARAKDIVENASTTRLTIAEVAHGCGLSPVYLTRLFRQVEGVSLYRYHLDVRLARSLAELRHCESISTLAHDLGFASHSHFSSAFHMRYGIAPSDYRNGCVLPHRAG